MAFGAGIGSLLSGLLGSIGTNDQNKANQKNQQNSYQQAGNTIWDSSQMVEQLLKNLTGGGQINAPQQFGGGGTIGGGIMGQNGQFSTPQAGGQQMSPQIMQMLQSLMGNSGGRPPAAPGAPNIPGQMHPGALGAPQTGGGQPNTGGGSFSGPLPSQIQNGGNGLQGIRTM